MANEEIAIQNVDRTQIEQDPSIIIYTNNKQSKIKIRAKPLPTEITLLLEKSTDLLKALSQHIKTIQGFSKNKDNLHNNIQNLHINNGTEISHHNLSDRMLKLIEAFKEELQSLCSNLSIEWKNIVDQIWSVGPRNCGPNLLLNHTLDYETRYLHHDKVIKEDARFEYESSFVNGFQLASLAGPLCEEPMMGVAFCVEEWTLENNDSEESTSQIFGPLSGNILTYLNNI